jgi:hypothetical protein
MRKLTTGKARALLYLLVGVCIIILLLIAWATWWDVSLIEAR